MKKNKAFTLAEVLITLGIIGVVSAITISIFVKNYQKMVWANQFKTNYSLLDQGIKKMMADDGVDYLFDTEAFKSITSYCVYSNSPESDSNCLKFFNDLNRYFKIIAIKNNNNYSYKYLNQTTSNSYNNNYYAIFLSNGTMLFNYSFNKPPYPYDYAFWNEKNKQLGIHGGSAQASFDIDINGLKKPNIYGRDIFTIYVTEKGILAPMGGYTWTGLMRSGSAKTSEELKLILTNSPQGPICNNNSKNPINGNGCAGYLVEQSNWKMDY